MAAGKRVSSARQSSSPHGFGMDGGTGPTECIDRENGPPEPSSERRACLHGLILDLQHTLPSLCLFLGE